MCFYFIVECRDSVHILEYHAAYIVIVSSDTVILSFWMKALQDLSPNAPTRESWLCCFYLFILANQTWADQDDRNVLHKVYFVGDVPCMPFYWKCVYLYSVNALSSARSQFKHLFFFLLRSSNSSIHLHPTFYFFLLWTVSLLKWCCVGASLASKSSNQSCLLSEIAGVRFGRIGTFNTWDWASLEDDLISCFLSRSLCGLLRAAAGFERFVATSRRHVQSLLFAQSHNWTAVLIILMSNVCTKPKRRRTKHLKEDNMNRLLHKQLE